ncbi:hypothetical protein COT97_00915 [Candidatus Falkowbacteria bacterium CG10_big_fil_rev_8_21_14_0_10_39_11]|uniref:Uncharacterized protein n=1 Tax=Candidatus Falkowbacteria bacterium CG10_big_fil_rev_8_21_14_0_10_39_11 TaxID=1974565 RepID=A0A2H0V604_9BACT|nr:MAG: hypothetical protein COT97_00915 [Candidatus Falkowbacteria bacterium CG10_big_fil_rev_8_21_14_0_10_39_11]
MFTNTEEGDIIAKRSLILRHSAKFYIPPRLSFISNLDLVGCEFLESLPEQLIVRDTLFLDKGCSDLVRSQADAFKKNNQIGDLQYI